MDEVHINWVHPTKEESTKAAKDMCTHYGMDGLLTKPAGPKSLHCTGEAIDMNID